MKKRTFIISLEQTWWSEKIFYSDTILKFLKEELLNHLIFNPWVFIPFSLRNVKIGVSFRYANKRTMKWDRKHKIKKSFLYIVLFMANPQSSSYEWEKKEHNEMTLGVPCIGKRVWIVMGKVFVYFFYFQSISFFASSCLSVFINLDEADFHRKLFFGLKEEREKERKFIKSAIKMISTSLFHPLIFFFFI